MRIALITDGIWPYVIGGMQKHSYNLCKYLSRRQIEVLLVHSNPASHPGAENLDAFTEEERRYINAILVEPPPVARFPGHYIYQSYLHSKQIFKNLLPELQQADFIIAKGLTGWYLTAHKETLPPIAINIHGYEFMQKQADLRSRLEAALLRGPLTRINLQADYVFSYGGNITGLIRKLGVPEERILEFPAGIEEDWVAERPADIPGMRRFVFLGRFERRKGIEELHQVIAALANNQPFEFHFIGPIPDEKKLHLPQVIYHGTLTGKEAIREILRQSHFLVCPSYSEGMPNVILEAMANGCAIIASDVGAVNVLVDEACGLLVPPGDTSALSEAIKAAIQMDDQQLAAFRNNALEKVKTQFVWNRIVDSLVHRINHIIHEDA